MERETKMFVRGLALGLAVGVGIGAAFYQEMTSRSDPAPRRYITIESPQNVGREIGGRIIGEPGYTGR